MKWVIILIIFVLLISLLSLTIDKGMKEHEKLASMSPEEKRAYFEEKLSSINDANRQIEDANRINTSKIVLAVSLIVILLSLGVFWVVAPAIMKDKVVSLVSSFNNDRQCFNYYKNEKNYFINPDSAYIESSRILPKAEVNEDYGYSSILEVKVFAHNAMGGLCV